MDRPGPRDTVPISTENLDAALHPGTILRVTFRPVAAMKRYCIRTICEVTRVEKSGSPGGSVEVDIVVEFGDTQGAPVPAVGRK